MTDKDNIYTRYDKLYLKNTKEANKWLVKIKLLHL